MVASAKSETAPPVYASDQEKAAGVPGKGPGDTAPAPSIRNEFGHVSQDHTHRQLKSRHIQLIGIGGTIGTALYVSLSSSRSGCFIGRVTGFL